MSEHRGTSLLVGGHLALVELDSAQRREEPRPAGLVSEALLNRALGILFAQEKVDCFGVAELDISEELP